MDEFSEVCYDDYVGRFNANRPFLSLNEYFVADIMKQIRETYVAYSVLAIYAYQLSSSNSRNFFNHFLRFSFLYRYISVSFIVILLSRC